jgi:plastocyanin
MNLIVPIKYLLVFSCLLGLLGFQFHSVSAHKSESADEVVIHVDKHGFKPHTITIKAGTKVTFENVGAEEYWPASDSHPSHTLYANTNIGQHCSPEASPTFDSCGSIAAGQSWSFIFDKVGTHQYHDHLWPHLVGEITVKGPTDQTAVQKDTFAGFKAFYKKVFYMISSFFVTNEEDISLNTGNSERHFYEALRLKYESIVEQADPRIAIQVLRQDSFQDENVSALCHDLLHNIGHAAYDKYGSFEDAILYQSDFCNSGYIHGLFEAYFKSVEDPLLGLSQQCAEYASDKRQFDLWQCHHGIGHGFMYLSGGDLDESLALCEQGLEGNAVASCQNGVYMELFNLELLAKESSFVDPDNPFLTCSARETAKADCYMYVPTYLSQTLKVDFSDIFEECNKAEFGYKNSCIRGVGSEAMKRNMKNTNHVFTLCSKAGSFINQELCVRGAVSMTMNQNGSYASGIKLCESSPSNYRFTCDSTANAQESFFR